MLRSFALLAIVSVLALSGCRAAPIYNATDIAFATPVQRSLSLNDYRAAIIRAGAKRGWTFQDEGPGHLVGDVAVRGKHFATVDVFFDTDKFSITYRDSRNLNYNESRKEIHPNYNSWVNNLQSDIQSEIALLRAGA